MKRFRIGHSLKTNLWVVPLLFVLGGVVLSLTITALDNGHLVPQRITGDPTSALQILYLIAFSMLTLTGLVLSLIVVVVQLAMGIFSPRIVRQILHDRPSQCAIGLFAGTFAYTVLVMRRVQSLKDDKVPGLAVMVAVLLVLTCIGTLVWYVNHIGQSLRVAALVGWVANDTMTTIETMYPDAGPPQEADPHLISASRGGVVFKVDHDRLVTLAEQADCCMHLLWAVGDFVPSGAPLLRIDGDPQRLATHSAAANVALGPERTLNQDVAYGIRMLVDIAERSLSSGPFEDPTTAVQAIDRLHELLRQLVRRPMHDGRHHDATGVLRLVAPTMTWNGYVRLAFDEIRQAGYGSPQITRRLASALGDLLTVAPPERRAPLQRQLDLLRDLVARSTASAEDQAVALIPDPAGIGSAPELLE